MIDIFTAAEVCVNAHVSGCARQTFVLSVCNVLIRLRIDVFFGKTKVDDVDNVVFIVRVSADEEVLGFDVTKYQTFRVNVFHATNLKRRNHLLLSDNFYKCTDMQLLDITISLFFCKDFCGELNGLIKCSSTTSSRTHDHATSRL